MIFWGLFLDQHLLLLFRVRKQLVKEDRELPLLDFIYFLYIVKVENPTHCDFVKLRTMLITHMQDLQEVTNDVHYENYR